MEDLSIGSVLAKATPQLGPYRPQLPGSQPIAPGSLRDFLHNGMSKRHFDAMESETRAWPCCKRKKGFIEVFADGDWCVTLLRCALIVLKYLLY